MTEKLYNSLITPTGTPDMTLNGAINNSVTSIVVNSVPGNVTAGNTRIRIEDEIMLVTGIAGTTLTVTRAAENSAQLPAASHADLSNIYLVFTPGAAANYANENGSVVLIARQTPTGTNVDFTSIPGTYSHLQIVWQAQGTDASAQDSTLQFNGDTGTNYIVTYEYLRGNGTIVNARELGNQTGLLCAATAPVGTITGPSTGGEIVIHNYSGTSFYKTIQARMLYSDGTLIYNFFGGGWWNDTSAITEVKITLNAGNFVSGSVFSLYGLL